MTVEPHPDAARPLPKTPMPPLDTRAPRPPVVRLRKGVVAGVAMAGAGLLAGSLAWAFVVQPELRANALEARRDARPAEVRGKVRPSDRVTDGPATYADLDRLPEPRRLGENAETPAASAASRPDRAPSPPVRSAHQEVLQAARNSGLFFGRSGTASSRDEGTGDAGAMVGGGGVAGQARGDYAAVYNPHALLAPLSPYEVKAGSILPAALLTAIDTSRGGPVTASVTENVFDSVTGRHLLIPQGTRLIGRHEGESRYGDRRAFIVWDRLILPNGKSLVLPKEAGVDAQGAVGVKGEVDRRLGSLLMATLFAGAITTLGQVARDGDDRSGGLLGDAGDAAAIEAAQVGGKLIDRELEVRPSIRLPSGARVRVFITRDLILEPYRS